MATTPRTRRAQSRRKVTPKLPRSTPEAIREFREKSPRLRLISVWLVLIVGMLGLTGRLAYLLLVIGGDLKVMAEEQQATQTTPRAARRQMVDRQGNVVAMDRVVYTLYVHPKLFKETPEAIATSLSNVLTTDALKGNTQSLMQRFGEQETVIKLVTDISEETAKRLRDLRLDGLDLLPSPRRVYPQGELFSQVTGYTDLEGVPKEGIELSLGSQLAYPELSSAEAAALQLVTRDDQQMKLTIDSRLQRIARCARRPVRQRGSYPRHRVPNSPVVRDCSCQRCVLLWSRRALRTNSG